MNNWNFNFIYFFFSRNTVSIHQWQHFSYKHVLISQWLGKGTCVNYSLIENRNILSYNTCTLSFVIFLWQIEQILTSTLHDYTIRFYYLIDNIKTTFVIIVIANHLLVVGGNLIALHRQKISYQLHRSCTKLSG